VSAYFYGNDEPTLYTDPSGLCWTGLCWAKHAGQWAERHPHVVVDAAAAVCVVASLGGCGYVAVGAVVTTIGTSASRNLHGKKKKNYGRFAADDSTVSARRRDHSERNAVLVTGRCSF